MFPGCGRTAWERLPLKFRFAEAKSIYGRQDSATVNMLDKCIALGVVVKTGKGRYEKVAARTLKCVE